MTTTNDHPKMSGMFYLVATDAQGNGLYGYRNWRVGGKQFKLRTPDGQEKDWTDNPPYPGKTRPMKAPSGRWKWDQDLKEGFA